MNGIGSSTVSWKPTLSRPKVITVAAQEMGYPGAVFTTLISVQALASLVSSDATQDCLVFDVRSDLGNPKLGRENYEAGHLAGAFFLDLNNDLAGPKQIANGVPITGRHPLPNREELANKLAALGLKNTSQAVVYDAGNIMYAARLWWLLKWLGHENVAVLDGGFAAWQAEGKPVTREPSHAAAVGDFQAGAPLTLQVTVEDLVADVAGKRRFLILDARAGERYRGESEPIDPVAGHIPGALNRPFAHNLQADGRFKTPSVLKQEFESLLLGVDASRVVQQCGSGVTACHNILAMAYAGLGTSSLYPGSWSEWSADKGRPIATGSARG
jgi:thiosulfate/3-mercaptopyruvate sulfurtransferase